MLWRWIWTTYSCSLTVCEALWHQSPFQICSATHFLVHLSILTIDPTFTPLSQSPKKQIPRHCWHAMRCKQSTSMSGWARWQGWFQCNMGDHGKEQGCGVVQQAKERGEEKEALSLRNAGALETHTKEKRQYAWDIGLKGAGHYHLFPSLSQITPDILSWP